MDGHSRLPLLSIGIFVVLSRTRGGGRYGSGSGSRDVGRAGYRGGKREQDERVPCSAHLQRVGIGYAYGTGSGGVHKLGFLASGVFGLIAFSY